MGPRVSPAYLVEVLSHDLMLCVEKLPALLSNTTMFALYLY
jgi:hypothetical protein